MQPAWSNLKSESESESVRLAGPGADWPPAVLAGYRLQVGHHDGVQASDLPGSSVVLNIVT